jgi:hypothetical protein
MYDITFLKWLTIIRWIIKKQLKLFEMLHLFLMINQRNLELNHQCQSKKICLENSKKADEKDRNPTIGEKDNHLKRLKLRSLKLKFII